VNLRRRLERLEAALGSGQDQESDVEETAEQQRRWEETLRHLGEMIPEDLWDRVRAALEDRGCLLWRWIEDVFQGRSRLPGCLTEEVMRSLVLIRLDEADKCQPWEAVCLRCGLQYPMHRYPPISEWKLAPGCAPEERPLRYDLPHFFDHDGCPACGASSKVGEMNWAHLIGDGHWFAADQRAVDLPPPDPAEPRDPTDRPTVEREGQAP
jgi:hypothetical protein